MRLFFFCLLAFGCSQMSTTAQTADFLISDVRLFNGQIIQEHMDVAVKDGYIMHISSFPAAIEADSIIDGAGRTLVPGLINAHVHAWFPAHLQEAAQAGVLTVLDMHGSKWGADMLRNLRDSTGYARYYGAGPGITVPGGHGTQFGMPTPTVDSVTTTSQFIKDRKAEGSDYIKILREPMRPTLTDAQLDSAIQIAKEEELLVVSHISQAEDAALLSRLGIDALVHTWMNGTLSDAQMDSLGQRNLAMVPTILTNLLVFELVASQGRSFPHLDSVALLGEVSRLHQAGVVMLAGTDPPNANINYGDDLIRELELLVQAGLTPLEALRAATSNTARVFRLDRGGFIKLGASADLLLVEGNPNQTIGDLRNVVRVWKGGVSIR